MTPMASIEPRNLWRVDMRSCKSAPRNIDEYIACFPPDVQATLINLRSTISKAAPGAKEAIKYAIPTFTLKGNLVHFGAYSKHIGFYPTSSGIASFKKELSGYEVTRGTVRFPLDTKLPLNLVRKIVKFRVKENLESAGAKGKKK